MIFKIPNVLVDTIAVGLVLLVTGCTVIPVPLTQEEIQKRVQADLKNLTQFQEPVGKSITLYEAMARAVKFNLEARVQGLKEMVARFPEEVTKERIAKFTALMTIRTAQSLAEWLLKNVAEAKKAQAESKTSGESGKVH